MKQVIILDRDGVINVDQGYTFKELQFVDNALKGLKSLTQKGDLFIATNQSGISRGFFSLLDMKNFNYQLLEELLKESIIVREIMHCPHEPTTIKSQQCNCRKPSPGMLSAIINQYPSDYNFAMIGDSETDMIAALAAKVQIRILVKTGKPLTDVGVRCATHVVKDLVAASRIFK